MYRVFLAAFKLIGIIITVAVIVFGLLHWQLQKKDSPDIYVTTSTAKHTGPNITAARHQKVIRILVLNGGGVRGLIPLEALKYLEQRTKEPTAKLFDMVVATSTGSIISSLMLLPNKHHQPKYSAAEAIQLYIKDSRIALHQSLFRYIATLDGLLGPKYGTYEKYAILQQYLRGVRFNQLLLPTIFTAYMPLAEKAEKMNNWNSWAKDYPLPALIQGITCAPSFFSPQRIINRSNHQMHILLDGGLYNNDPAVTALAKAMILYPNDTYVIVDLGGGMRSPNYSYDNLEHWGKLNWAKTIAPFMINAQVMNSTETMTELASQAILPRIKYYSINTLLPHNEETMDNVSRKNIYNLIGTGEAMVNADKKKLNQLAKILQTDRLRS